MALRGGKWEQRKFEKRREERGKGPDLRVRSADLSSSETGAAESLIRGKQRKSSRREEIKEPIVGIPTEKRK